MKSVIKARTIGDKLYHLGRVHSKIVFLNSEYNGIKQGDLLRIQINALENLKGYLNCLFPNTTVKVCKDYIQSINQAISAISKENKKDIFICSCYMQSCFSRFQKFVLKNPEDYCQSYFDSFCLPLFILELERKKIKLSNKKKKPWDNSGNHSHLEK